MVQIRLNISAAPPYALIADVDFTYYFVDAQVISSKLKNLRQKTDNVLEKTDSLQKKTSLQIFPTEVSAFGIHPNYSQS